MYLGRDRIQVEMFTLTVYGVVINPRRACAARVTALSLSVCLSVTTSLAYQAAKSLKFEHR